MKDLLVKINAEIETFKTESETLTEKGIKLPDQELVNQVWNLKSYSKNLEKSLLHQQKNNLC